jgi:hypothetical protein
MLPICLGGTVLYLAATPSGGASEENGVLRFEEAGLVYTYHTLTGSEGLFDLETDPRLLQNLIVTRPRDARRLRKALERELSVESLEELRQEQDSEIRALESLGYL